MFWLSRNCNVFRFIYSYDSTLLVEGGGGLNAFAFLTFLLRQFREAENVLGRELISAWKLWGRVIKNPWWPLSFYFFSTFSHHSASTSKRYTWDSKTHLCSTSAFLCLVSPTNLHLTVKSWLLCLIIYCFVYWPVKDSFSLCRPITFAFKCCDMFGWNWQTWWRISQDCMNMLQEKELTLVERNSSQLRWS